jgi:hypothetical protein
MKLPPIQGTFDQQDFFIYAACDHGYFRDFGHSFVNSIKTNTSYGIHIHLFNPTADQIDHCQRNGVGVTWEHVHQPIFAPAAQRWNPPPFQEPEKSRYDRTINAMGKSNDRSVLERMQKTYYACARFIRLAELCGNKSLLAVDIDAVVRRPVSDLGKAHDFFIHYISGKKARYLAGGLWLNGTDQCADFLHEYAAQLTTYFENDYVYWGLDQDLLDPIVPKFNHGQLPMSYIDWNMHKDSYIWTAKGTRKELSVFVNEQKKYSS